MPTPVSRATYAAMFGPPTGARVRLGDMELIIQMERDFTTCGDEVKFGGGRVIRDGMDQSQITRTRGAIHTAITNALMWIIPGFIRQMWACVTGVLARSARQAIPMRKVASM